MRIMEKDVLERAIRRLNPQKGYGFCDCCGRFVPAAESMLYLRSNSLVTDKNGERYVCVMEWSAHICIDCEQKIKGMMKKTRW